MFFKMFTMPSKLIDHMHRCIVRIITFTTKTIDKKVKGLNIYKAIVVRYLFHITFISNFPFL